MLDGTIQPAALKTLQYDTLEQQFKANAELAGLRDCEGCPYLGQCLAIFRCQQGDMQCLLVLLECVLSSPDCPDMPCVQVIFISCMLITSWLLCCTAARNAKQ